MKIDYSKILKTAAKASFYIISRTLASGIFGLFINIVILLLLIPEMGIVLDKIGGIPAARAGGIGAILALIVIITAAWPVTLMIIGFGIAFPVIYFIFGKKHGITKAVHYVINNNKEFIIVYFFDKLTEYVKSRYGLKDIMDVKSLKTEIIENLPGYLKKMDNMPRPIRLLFRYIFGKPSFDGMARVIIDHGGDELNTEAMADIAKDKFEEFIDEKIFRPTLSWFRILFGVNFLLFIILKIAI